MKVVMFSSKPSDHTYFDATNDEGHQMVYLEPHMHKQTVALAAGADAVCCFVNDTRNAELLSQLKELGVALVAIRCAGYNNVDLARRNADHHQPRGLG